MIKQGDKLLCKRTTIIGNIVENNLYTVENALHYSTTSTTILNWKNNIINKRYESFFTVRINNTDFSNFDIYDYFYTKQEERKIKLKKINSKN